MIIFATKHFSTKNAGVFSVLINTAIYLRAALALGTRFVERMWLFVADAAVIYGGMYVLIMFWQAYIKDIPGNYPVEFLQYVVPAYVGVWILSVFTQGGYKPMAKFYKQPPMTGDGE